MNKWWWAGLSFPAIAGLIWIAITNVTGVHAQARARSPQDTPKVTNPAPVPMPQSAVAPRKMPDSPQSDTPATNRPGAPSPVEPMPTKALQELLDKDPAAALIVARRDLAQDPDGPDAAERNWVVVKALAVMGQFAEAKREAAVMVPKYRDTQWANDVERHVLAHP